MKNLVEEPVDRRALEAEIAAALSDPKSQIFIDTSTIVWLHRLHTAARTEFLDWMMNGPPSPRVRVPARVIHEFSRHRSDAKVLRPFRAQLSGLARLLDQLNQWAHLVTDDALAAANGFPDRAAYFALIDATRANADRIVKPLLSADSLEEAERAIVPALNSLALEGDVFASLRDVQREFEARAEIRLPPGYMDMNKAKAPADSETPLNALPTNSGANRLGDFAIWNEILTFCETKDDTTAVVIVTHDTKEDWVYKPKKIVDLDGRTKSNSDKRSLSVGVAHPMLSLELFTRTGIEKLYVVTTPTLAHVVAHHSIGVSLVELAKAVQAEVVESSSGQTAAEEATVSVDVEIAAENGIVVAPVAEADGNAVQEDAAVPDGNVPPEGLPIVAFLDALPQQALADHLFISDPAGLQVLDKHIRELKSHNWYRQNPATRPAIKALFGVGASLMQSFILGRNLYQAACGSAAVPLEVLSDLDHELEGADDGLSQALFAGIIFEAYFDSHGALRAMPKAEAIDAVFQYQAVPRFAVVVEWLRARLAVVQSKYLALPNVQPEIRTVSIAHDGVAATAIKHQEIDLAVDADSDDALLPLSSSTSHQGLLRRLCRHFAVPEFQVQIEPVFQGNLDCSQLSLRSWGPHTEILLQ